MLANIADERQENAANNFFGIAPSMTDLIIEVSFQVRKGGTLIAHQAL